MSRSTTILIIKPELRPIFVASNKVGLPMFFVSIGLFIVIRQIFPSVSWLDFLCDGICIVVILSNFLLLGYAYLQRIITTYYITTEGIIIEKRIGRHCSRHGLRYKNMKREAWYYSYGHDIGTVYINWRHPLAYGDVSSYWLRPVIHKKRTALYYIANGKYVRDVINEQWQKANHRNMYS